MRLTATFGLICILVAAIGVKYKTSSKHHCSYRRAALYIHSEYAEMLVADYDRCSESITRTVSHATWPLPQPGRTPKDQPSAASRTQSDSNVPSSEQVAHQLHKQQLVNTLTELKQQALTQGALSFAIVSDTGWNQSEKSKDLMVAVATRLSEPITPLSHEQKTALQIRRPSLLWPDQSADPEVSLLWHLENDQHWLAKQSDARALLWYDMPWSLDKVSFQLRAAVQRHRRKHSISRDRSLSLSEVQKAYQELKASEEKLFAGTYLDLSKDSWAATAFASTVESVSKTASESASKPASERQSLTALSDSRELRLLLEQATGNGLTSINRDSVAELFKEQFREFRKEKNQAVPSKSMLKIFWVWQTMKEMDIERIQFRAQPIGPMILSKAHLWKSKEDQQALSVARWLQSATSYIEPM